MSMQLDLTFEVIPFADWRAGIAPLWNMEGRESRIAMAINGHGHLRYAGRELAQRVLFFPVAAAWRGQRIGWTSIFNVSDEALRVRGIYVPARDAQPGRRPADGRVRRELCGRPASGAR